MAKWTDVGENAVADVFFKGTTAPSFYIGLYTNVSEPAEAAVLADVTEPSGFGYARQQVTAGNWTLSTDHVTSPELTFTASGGSWGTVTGWFLCTVSSGTSGSLLAVETFGTSYTMTDGSSLKLTATITVA
jgi:hypothetical protein